MRPFQDFPLCPHRSGSPTADCPSRHMSSDLATRTTPLSPSQSCSQRGEWALITGKHIPSWASLIITTREWPRLASSISSGVSQRTPLRSATRNTLSAYRPWSTVVDVPVALRSDRGSSAGAPAPRRASGPRMAPGAGTAESRTDAAIAVPAPSQAPLPGARSQSGSAPLRR